MPCEQRLANVWRPCSRCSARSNWLERPSIGAAQVIDRAGEVEVLLDGQIVKESKIFRQHPDPPLDFESVANHIEPGDARRSGSRREQTGQHLHGRRFPGAIGP